MEINEIVSISDVSYRKSAGEFYFYLHGKCGLTERVASSSYGKICETWSDFRDEINRQKRMMAK